MGEAMNSQPREIAVIGGGPGGYAAALYGARAGRRVLVLEQIGPGGQMAATSQVDNYPGFDAGIEGFELGERMKKGAERFGAQTWTVRVTGVELRSCPKRIQITGGNIEAETVILATGAYPRKLGLPGEQELQGKGISCCAACDGMLYRGKTVVVVGGGNTAAGDALLLSKLCQKVYLVHRRDRLSADAVYADALEHSRVELIWDHQVTELLHEERLTGVRLRSVKTGENREVRCDGLFLAVGRVPDTELVAGQVERDAGGYLIADESTRTNLPGIFAVGDARTKAVRQIVTAAADGAVAAHFAEEYLELRGERGERG